MTDCENRKISPDLADLYPGDSAWTAFAFAYGSDSGDIVSVAVAILGHNSAAWFSRSIPAFHGLSPNQMLARGSAVKNAIRTILMRMP